MILSPHGPRRPTGRPGTAAGGDYPPAARGTCELGHWVSTNRGFATQAPSGRERLAEIIGATSVCADLPDLRMLLGRTVIAASGLSVFYREAVLGKR